MQVSRQRKLWWSEEVEQRLPFWGSELAIPLLVIGLQRYISFPSPQSRTPSLSRGCWNKRYATQASSDPDALHFLRKVPKAATHWLNVSEPAPCHLQVLEPTLHCLKLP
ncbi:hypothetical protein AMECASPLE_007190 [Ameca splendens]|uniref:Uncharacterized protein n=1 Tax=Ameca splendens TaxID=208324 RepID=A0ABV0XCP9_9TELE